MSSVLPLIALGLSALVLLYAAMRGGKGRAGLPPEQKPYVLATLAVLILAALLTLPTGKPWSPGQTLWPGLLLGGAAVLAASFLATPASAVTAATIGVGVLLLFYARYALDPLAGFMLGAVTAGVLVGGGCAVARDEGNPRERAGAVEFAVLACVAVAAATYLATHHRGPTGLREWQALPALLASVVAIALLGGELLQRDRRGGLAAAGAVILPPVLIALAVAYRLHGTAPFWQVAVLGLALFAVTGWLGRSRAELPGSPAAVGVDTGLLSALLVLGGAALAFRWLHGYGIGLLLVAGLAAAGLSASATSSAALRGSLGVGVLVLLYRVYTERTGFSKGLELDFIYYYVALIFGALFAPLLLQLLPSASADRAETTPRLLRLGLMGALAASVPLGVWLLFGERAQAALVVGLAIGAVYQLARGTDDLAAGLGRTLAIGAALSAMQLTNILGDAGDKTRGERIVILMVVGVLLAIWLGAVILLEQRRGTRSTDAAVTTG